MKKLSSYLLNEDFHNRRILKEEIYPETKTAVVYHLTGIPWKGGNLFKELEDLKSKNIDVEYSNAPEYLFHTPLKELMFGQYSKEIDELRKKSQGEEGYSKFLATPQGKSYWIANHLFKGIYSGGSSFRAGSGAAYGKGLYTCYELNPSIASRYGDVILKFEVDISNFIIFVEDIAKKVHGENYRLEDQFTSILQRKGFNLNVIEDVSTDVGEIMSSFLNTLSDFSDTGTDQNTDYIGGRMGVAGSTTGVRTAGVASKCLYEFSRLTNSKVKLRELVDGIIFFGSGDGPVCLIYRPETSNNYYPVGAGFFNKQGNAVIVDDLERLRGFKGIKLPLKVRAAKMSKEREGTKAYTKKQAHDGLIEEKIQALGEIVRNQEDPYIDFLVELKKKMTGWHMDRALVEKVMKARFENSKTKVMNWCQFMSWFLNTSANMFPKILDPTVKLINLLGPGTEIINAEEFIQYHGLFIELSGFIQKQGIKPRAFEYIRRARHLKFNDEFLRIINHTTDKSQMKNELNNLAGGKFLDLFAYHGDGYKDLLDLNTLMAEFFGDGWVDMNDVDPYIPQNIRSNSEGVRLDTSSDAEVVASHETSEQHKLMLKGITDFVESNLEHKTRFYKELRQTGDFKPNAFTDVSKPFVLTENPVISGLGNWSDVIDSCGALFYSVLDKGNNPQVFKSIISRYKGVPFDVSYCEVIKSMFDYNLGQGSSIDSNTISRLEVNGVNCYISNTIIDYPQKTRLASSWSSILNGMIDFKLYESEQILEDTLQEKTDNLLGCLEMELDEDPYSNYLYDKTRRDSVKI